MWIALVAVLATQPETMGPYAIEEIDAGNVLADGVEIPTRIFVPTAAERFPIVGVIHGFLRNGSYQRVMAETFASRGYVAIVPDMPCGLGGCDHDANARQLSALLEWAATESMVANRADGERRALVGHSWGGLGVHIATALDPKIDAVVCLDPNDDGNEGYDAAPMVLAPNATIIADTLGACNNTNWGGDTYPRTGTPHMRVRVVGSGHCDVEDPSDNLCPIGCGRGDPATSYLFRRYAIAFVTCVLDGANGDWIGGSAMMSDEMSGIIDQIDHAGLEMLPCRAVMGAEDGGVVGEDAGDGGAIEKDASVAVDGGMIDAGDEAEVPIDAGVATDAEPKVGSDAGDVSRPDESGCSAIRGDNLTCIALVALVGLLFRRRFRR